MAGQVLSGTWEEISGHASELAGKTLQVTILTDPSPETAASVQDETRDALRRIMARQAGTRETDPATFVYRDGPAHS